MINWKQDVTFNFLQNVCFSSHFDLDNNVIKELSFNISGPLTGFGDTLHFMFTLKRNYLSTTLSQTIANTTTNSSGRSKNRCYQSREWGSISTTAFHARQGRVLAGSGSVCGKSELWETTTVWAWTSIIWVVGSLANIKGWKIVFINIWEFRIVSANSLFKKK